MENSEKNVGNRADGDESLRQLMRMTGPLSGELIESLGACFDLSAITFELLEEIIIWADPDVRWRFEKAWCLMFFRDEMSSMVSAGLSVEEASTVVRRTRGSSDPQAIASAIMSIGGMEPERRRFAFRSLGFKIEDEAGDSRGPEESSSKAAKAATGTLGGSRKAAKEAGKLEMERIRTERLNAYMEGMERTMIAKREIEEKRLAARERARRQKEEESRIAEERRAARVAERAAARAMDRAAGQRTSFIARQIKSNMTKKLLTGLLEHFVLKSGVDLSDFEDLSTDVNEKGESLQMIDLLGRGYDLIAGNDNSREIIKGLLRMSQQGKVIADAVDWYESCFKRLDITYDSDAMFREILLCHDLYLKDGFEFTLKKRACLSDSAGRLLESIGDMSPSTKFSLVKPSGNGFVKFKPSTKAMIDEIFSDGDPSRTTSLKENVLSMDRLRFILSCAWVHPNMFGESNYNYLVDAAGLSGSPEKRYLDSEYYIFWYGVTYGELEEIEFNGETRYVPKENDPEMFGELLRDWKIFGYSLFDTAGCYGSMFEFSTDQNLTITTPEKWKCPRNDRNHHGTEMYHAAAHVFANPLGHYRLTHSLGFYSAEGYEKAILFYRRRFRMLMELAYPMTHSGWKALFGCFKNGKCLPLLIESVSGSNNFEVMKSIRDCIYKNRILFQSSCHDLRSYLKARDIRFFEWMFQSEQNGNIVDHGADSERDCGLACFKSYEIACSKTEPEVPNTWIEEFNDLQSKEGSDVELWFDRLNASIGSVEPNMAIDCRITVKDESKDHFGCPPYDLRLELLKIHETHVIQEDGSWRRIGFSREELRMAHELTTEKAQKLLDDSGDSYMQRLIEEVSNEISSSVRVDVFDGFEGNMEKLAGTWKNYLFDKHPPRLKISQLFESR